MDEHTLKVLELDKIKRRLEAKCFSELGKKLVQNLTPLTDEKEIRESLKQTTEFKEILSYEEKFPQLRFKDIKDSLKKAGVEGTYLEPGELLNIYENVLLCRSLLKFMKGKGRKYPRIDLLTSKLKSFDELASTITKKIDKQAQVKDNATPELLSFRRKKKTLRNRLLDKLQSLLGSRKVKGHRQDDIITIRDGRYVIPMSEAQFRASKGIVHDRSASGATLFVEPLVTVELNNELRELELQEEKEIEKILKGLTSLVRKERKELGKSLEILQILDFIQAKATFSIDFKCTQPILNQNGYINLVNARHPLITPQKNVIPLSLELGKDFTTLVITGPNTGGKTVALKTIGLLNLMAQAGMHVPADPGTEVGIFQKIYADIGDEQSIEASLSTFSSHLSRIIKAIKEADSESLVLLDELGAGTDPKEGAALGETVIDDLTHKEVRTVITTHQGALKVLAEVYPKVENASLEFDRKTLKPTYRFQMGFPGASYAVEIASRLGMPKALIKKASQLVGSKERDLGTLLEKVQKNLDVVRENRKKLDEQRKISDDLLNLYRDRLKKLESSKKESKTRALKESKELVETTRKKIESLVAQIRKTQAEKEAIKQAQEFVKEKKEEIDSELEKIEKKVVKRKGEIKVGDLVWIDSLQIEGEVLNQPDQSGKVKVRIGNLTSIVEQSELSKIEGEPAKKNISTTGYQLYSIKDIRPEIDLRGLSSDEAMEKVDKYLDDAYLAGLSIVQVIHGKGTGVLRKRMQEFLKDHPKVESYRLGEWNEGGSGVTIVKLKE
jgi:DNA mismatch repair protein MutS2